mgnify:CR=1 FL=1
MITYLISNDYEQTARCLDQVRLSRQIVECIQVVKVLQAYNVINDLFGHKMPFGILFPPVIKLWILSESQPGMSYLKDNHRTLIPELYHYFMVLCAEWERNNGKIHNCMSKFPGQNIRLGKMGKLQWSEEVYSSHRARLLEKDFGHYNQVFQREGLIVEKKRSYVWANPVVSVQY